MAIDKIFNDANVDGIADNIFGAVNNSVSEVKAMQQRKAAENVQMVVEAFKKIETNITEKFDNVTDVIEKRVLTIKDGRDGSSGSDGRNGRDGKPGRDGVNGKQGTPGTPGKDGVDGEDGVSVTNANIDFDGSLVISLSTGQQINVGEVVAPDLAEKIKIVSTMSTNGAVGIKDEGSSISTGVKNINFVGATVTATASGDDVTVNVSAGAGTVTSVAATVPAFLSVAGSPITTTGTLAISLSGTALPVANGGTGLTTGTSGGILAYTAAGTLASSTALAANALVVGGGAGVAPSTTTTGTGVKTALGVNTGTAGAFVVNGGALGTPSSGTVTNLTGTASININGTVGATTPGTGAFTTLSATGTLSGGTSGTGYSFSGSAPATSLALDSSGNLGIGTASPSTRLHVKETTAATPSARLQNANSAGAKYLSFDYDGSGGSYGNFQTQASTIVLQSGFNTGKIQLTPYNSGTYSATLGLVVDTNGGVAVSSTLAVGAATPSTSGSGITFPATQSASSDANTLDDYEEGTWTPALSTTTGSISFASPSGTYTKIGRLVYVRGSFGGTATISSPTGDLKLTNLPFTVGSPELAAGSTSPYFFTAGAYSINLETLGATTTAYIFNFENGTRSSAHSYIQNGCALNLSMCYQI